MTDDTLRLGAQRSDATTRAFLAVRAPLHADLSPDGGTLALTTVSVPQGTEDEVVELSLVDLASGRERRPAGSRAGDRVAQWSPDGDLLALLATEDEQTVLVLLDLAAGVRRTVPGTQGADGPPVWSPDARSIVLPRRRGTVVDRTRPYRWTRPFPAADGTGPLEDPPQLCLVDVASGASSWLTDDGWRWSTPRWSPSGDRVAAVASLDPTDRMGGQVLRVVDLAGGVADAPVPGGRSVVPRWLDDGTLVAVVAEPHGAPGGSDARLFAVSGPTVREIEVPHLFGDVFGDCPAELADSYDTVLLARGRTLAVRTGAGGRMGVALLDVDSGEVRTLLDGPRCCSPVALSDDAVVFTRQSADTYPQVATITLAEGGEERSVFDPAARPCAEVERFVVDLADGRPVDAWFLAPADAPRPLPTVVIVHGGPHFTYGEAFSLDAQALCAAGFGVLYTNPRGSTGYGDAFAHAVHGDWADGPSADLLAVVDEAAARGWVDPTRLGITGNSYGGYLSAWLASTTDRFRAAVVENPVTDLVGMYGTSDIGRRFFPAQLGGAPHEKAEVYLSQSPLLVAHRCRTPCLFVTGELDRRCPPGQAWAMHRVLCEVGTPSEVLVLPDSSHEGSTYGPPAARLAHNEALVEWMTAWLLPPTESEESR